MRQLLLRWGTPVLMAGLVPFVGCGSGEPPPKPDPRYGTPELTFAAFQKAMDGGDWAAAADCLTPDSRDAMAGMLVRTCIAMLEATAFADRAQQFGIEVDEEATAGMKRYSDRAREILQRHGISENVMLESGVDPHGVDNVDDYRALAAGIADKNRFIADAMVLMAPPPAERPPNRFAAIRLSDVRISGERATAASSDPNFNPVEFQRIDGNWKLQQDQLQ